MKRKIILLLTSVFIFFGLKANQFTDSLEYRLSVANDTSRVKMLCDLCWEYRYVSADSAIMFGERALQLAGSINYPKGQAQAYNDMGIVYIGSSDFQQALDYFGKAMEIRKKLGDTAGMASLYNKMGIVYQKQGNLKLALENQIQALKIYEQLQQDLWIGYSLNNIAIVHQNLGNLEKSLEYHFKALTYRKKMNDVYGEGGSLGNIGNVYVKMGDTAAAIGYYEKALSMLRKVQDAEAISVQLSNLGNIYAARGDYEKARDLLDESLQLREKMGDRKGISSALIKLGDLYLDQKKYKDAARALYRGLAIAKEISVVEEVMSAYLAIANMHALQNNHDSAFLYTNYYIATKDSVYEKRLAQQIVDVQEKYETEKREQQIALLKKERELTEIRLTQRKTEIGMLISLIVSIVGAAIFVLYRRRQMQKAVLDAAAIEHAEMQLKAVLEGQDQERQRIARELHDGVGQTLSGIKLNWENLSDSFDNSGKKKQLEKMAHMLDDVVTEVRSISHQMMPKELEQFGLVPAIRSVLQFSFGGTGISYSFEEDGLDARLPQPVELGLFRIIQELVSNILKHAGATKVNIRILHRNNRIILLVEDNGKGFDFDKVKGSGIGLMNISSRVEAIKGVLNYETAEGKGTIVTIRIPLEK